MEVAEELTRRRVDVCCLQETSWKGASADFIGPRGRRFKFWWKGNGGSGGVGIALVEDLIDSVMEVRKKSDRIMVVVMRYGGKVLRLFSCYAPQVGRRDEEKDSFYQDLQEELLERNQGDIVLLGGDFNGHVGSRTDGYEGIHGGFGIGSRNGEGRRLLELCSQARLMLVNTWFKKKRRVTFQSGTLSSEINFFAIDKFWRKLVKNIKIMPGELQHSLIVVKLQGVKVSKKKKVTRSCVKTWKLKDDSIREEFRCRMDEEWNVDQAGDSWEEYKRCVDKVSKEVCGISNGKQRHGETWWWRGDVPKAVTDKKKKFRQWKKGGLEEARANYNRSKRNAKRVVARAMKEKAEEEVQNGDCFFKKLKRIRKDARDVDECPCIRDTDGKIHHDERERASIWKTHMERIMNEENEWHDVLEATETAGPVKEISLEEIWKALKSLKNS